MEDWTDIFAEGLKDIEESLPADDWAVIQQKYSAAKRRRKTFLWSFTGVASAVAAVVALFVVLFNGTPDAASDMPQMADNETVVQTASDDPEIIVTPEDTLKEPESVPENIPVKKPEPKAEISVTRSGQADTQVEVLVAEAGDDEIDVVRDTVEHITEILIADSEPVAPSSDEWSRGEWIGEDLPEKQEPGRRRISIGMSGVTALTGGGIIPKMMDALPEQEAVPSEPGDNPVGSNPTPPDSSTVNGSASRSKVILPASRQTSRNTRKVISSDMDHYMPVSFGVSARFTLTERFSLNTGLNYTLYTSRRTVGYSDGTVEVDKQMVHYLGIPLRCDWMLVDKPRFGMYIGVGGQVDRCIYAKVGSERLYDNSFLWSVNAAMGLQYNITPRLSLYAEPELTGNIGHSLLDTYRNDAEVMITARFGLRINL